MDDQAFDSLARNSAGGISRRTSLAALSAAGLWAAFAGPLTADAKKWAGKKHKKQKKQKQNGQQCPPPADLCASQVGPCTDTLTAVCGGQAACQDSIACCSELGTCDFSGFFSCLTIAQTN